jgi:hypothetical protein
MMEKHNMTMTATQKADRLALIKDIATKRNAQASFKNKMKTKASKVQHWSDAVETPKRKAKNNSIDTMIAKMDENHNLWTDASKYADQYYGETMRETLKFDNDWD